MSLPWKARLKERQHRNRSMRRFGSFLLNMMGESVDIIRVRLRKKKKLKLPIRRKIGKAYEPEETKRMGAYPVCVCTAEYG